MKKLNLALLLLAPAAYIAADSSPQKIDVVVRADQKFNEIVEQARAQAWDNAEKEYRETTKFRNIPPQVFNNVMEIHLSHKAVTNALHSLHSDAKQSDEKQAHPGDKIITSHRQINDIIQGMRNKLYEELEDKEKLYQLEKARNTQERAKENNRAQSGWWIVRWWKGR